MANALLFVLVAIALAVIVFLAIASTKPDVFRVRRSAPIKESPQTV